MRPLARCPEVHTEAGVLIVNPGSVGLQTFADDGAQPYVGECGPPSQRAGLPAHAGAGA